MRLACKLLFILISVSGSQEKTQFRQQDKLYQAFPMKKLFQTMSPQGVVTRSSKEPQEVAKLPGAGADRGPLWYDDIPSDEAAAHTYSSDKSAESSDILDDSEGTDISVRKSRGSSKSTNEKGMRERVYRTCTPCPLDMVKKHKNLGIKWICAGYQRARRTFKSECMMRYRNCQDGTMFIKMNEGRCPDNSTVHGRHWFYMYKVD